LCKITYRPILHYWVKRSIRPSDQTEIVREISSHIVLYIVKLYERLEFGKVVKTISTIRLKNSMKFINGTFINIHDVGKLWQLSSSLNHGWTKKIKRKGEKGEKRQEGTQKLC